MYNLIKKDFALNGRLFALVLTMLLFLFLFGFLQNEFKGSVLFVFFIAKILPFIVFAGEERKNGTKLILSLPVQREIFIYSRYISAWIIFVSFFAAGIALSLFSGLAVYHTPPAVYFSGYNQTLTIIVFCVAAFEYSLFIPVSVKTGRTDFVLMLLIGINILIAIFSTFKNGKNEIIHFGYAALTFIILTLKDAINLIYNSYGLPAALLSASVFILLANYLSGRILLIIFKKKSI